MSPVWGAHALFRRSGGSPRRPGRRCRWRSRKRRNAAARRPAAALRSPEEADQLLAGVDGGDEAEQVLWPPRLWDAVPHMQGPRASGDLGLPYDLAIARFNWPARMSSLSCNAFTPASRQARRSTTNDAAANIYRRDRALRDATASVRVDALGITGRPVFHRSAPRVPAGIRSGSMAFVSGNGRANEPATSDVVRGETLAGASGCGAGPLSGSDLFWEATVSGRLGELLASAIDLPRTRSEPASGRRSDRREVRSGRNRPFGNGQRAAAETSRQGEGGRRRKQGGLRSWPRPWHALTWLS